MRQPKPEGFTGIVDAIPEAVAGRNEPRQQRHTAQRRLIGFCESGYVQ